MEKKYVLKLDENYYAGPNKKYADMYNISGSGPLGAKRLEKTEAEKLKEAFTKNGFEVEIEIYNPKMYLRTALEKIIQYENKWRKGNPPGYAIRNLAKESLEYLKQI